MTTRKKCAVKSNISARSSVIFSIIKNAKKKKKKKSLSRINLGHDKAKERKRSAEYQILILHFNNEDELILCG